MTGQLTFSRNAAQAEAAKLPETAAQARLNAICHYPAPVTDYFRSMVRWINKITADPESFSSAALTERDYALGPEIAELKRLTDNPPSDWTGETWTSHYVRLTKLEGQRAAIVWVLSLRSKQARRGGSGSGRGSKRSISTEVVGRDPFR
jgi:hypothetical protein